MSKCRNEIPQSASTSTIIVHIKVEDQRVILILILLYLLGDSRGQ